MKSPLTVSYKDMMEQARRRLLYMEKAYPIKVIQGSMTSYASTRAIAIQKELVKFLEKHKPVRQTRLF